MARRRTQKTHKPAKSARPDKSAKPGAAQSVAMRPVSIGAVVAVCIAAAVPGTFVGASIGFSDHYREVAAEVGFLGLLVYWLYRNRNLREITLNLSGTRGWLAGLLVLATASVFWSGDLGFFVSKYLLWLAAAAALLVTLTLKPDFDLMLKLARGFALIAAYIAVIGLVQALLAVDIFLQTHPPSANFHNKNAAMQVIVLVAPMLVFGLLFDRHKHLSIVYWFVLALALAYAFHTRTRSAWLALLLEAVIIIVGLLWHRGWLKTAIREGRVNWGRAQRLAAPASALLLAVLLNLSASGWGGFANTVSGATSSLQQDIASYSEQVSKRQSERYKIWSSALKMMETRPVLGSGMGSFSRNLLTESARYPVWAPLRVHNDLLETGVELGALGLLLLLGAVLGLLGGLLRLLRQADFAARCFYLLVAAALGGSALNMQFSFPYQMPVPLIIFAIYAGLILKSGDAVNPRIKSLTLTLQRRHWLGGLTVAGAACALALAVNLYWLQILFTADSNLTRRAWHDPVNPAPPLCHRGIVRLFFHLPSAYREAGRHQEIQGLVKSIEHCIPGTWLSQQITIADLLRKKRWPEVIPPLKHAINHAPPGIYVDHINLLATHLQQNNLPGALEVYENLINEPTERLIKRRVTLQTLVTFSVQTNKPEEAKKFYRLLNKHYKKKPEFEETIPGWVRE